MKNHSFILGLLVTVASGCGGRAELNDARPEYEGNASIFDGGLGLEAEEEQEAGAGNEDPGSADDPSADPDDPASDPPSEADDPTMADGENPNTPPGSTPPLSDPPSINPPTSQPAGPGSPQDCVGAEGCECYSNATCNDNLVCDDDRCVQPSAATPMPCLAGDEGTLGCDCYGNQTCNGGLVCVSGVCALADTPSTDDPTTPPPNMPAVPPMVVDPDDPTPPPATNPPIVRPPTTPTTTPPDGEPPPVPPIMVDPPIITPIDPDDPPPEGCEEERWQDRYSCGVQTYCEDEDTWEETYCWDEGGGVLYCDCYSAQDWMSLQLTGLSLSDGCGFMEQMCESGTTPDFGDEAVCEDQWVYSGTDWCDGQARCSYEADLGGGVTALSSTYYYANCQENGSDEWTCSCSGNSGQVSFNLDSGDAANLVCSEATDVCLDAQSATPSGPIACEQNFQSSGDNYCYAGMQCTQGASVGGLDVEIIGNLNAYCNQVEPGLYECTCESGSDSEAFEIASEEEPWDLCSEVILDCPDLVSIQIGGGGGGFGPTPFPIFRTTD